MPDIHSLLSLEALSNPYPIYHQFRSQKPVFLDKNVGCWVVTRYADVKSALSNPHLSSKRIKAERLIGKEWEEFRPLFYTISKQILLSDPPNHTRVRKLMHKAFTPRVIDTMRTHAQGDRPPPITTLS